MISALWTPAGLPSAAESARAPLGEDERSDGPGADLQRQAGLLGSQKQVCVHQPLYTADIRRVDLMGSVSLSSGWFISVATATSRSPATEERLNWMRTPSW